MTSTETITAALKQIPDPIAESDIVSSGVVRALQVSEAGAVSFVMEISPEHAGIFEAVKSAAETALGAIEGVTKVSIVMTGPANGGAPPNLKPQAQAQPQGPSKVPGVERIIAVASGKGGVGKSTVASNLACALVAQGRRVGLLDADVYGPSQPRMLGVSGRPASPDGTSIIPMHNHGVVTMSVGLMVDEEQAVVWRGPMLMKALQQMLRQVQWGPLDVLIVDLPPGTGDVQMTLAQTTQVDGAIIVSTPQDVALLDARKGIDMFRQLNVPILGMIENMSTHICSTCGAEEHVFGHGGVAAEAEKLEVPLLAEVPLDLQIRLAADSGAPIAIAQPDSAQARAFIDVATSLVANGNA